MKMRSGEKRRERVNILGVGISTINMRDALQQMERWIITREQNYICVTTVHLLMEAQKDHTLKRIINSAGLITPDGMPLVWLGKLLGYSNMDRVYGPDIMLNFSALAARKGYTSFYYGGMPGVAQKLSEKLTERFPGLEVVGIYSPPFGSLTPEEDEEVINMINKADPDVLWIGLGAPKQDIWMAEHIGRIRAPVIVGVGAAFDFLSGSKRQAPVWIQRSGFEWLFRLLSEPKRLWKRYLVTNTLFILSLAKRQLGILGEQTWKFTSKNGIGN